jgi:endo-1,4-beta-xylanase
MVAFDKIEPSRAEKIDSTLQVNFQEHRAAQLLSQADDQAKALPYLPTLHFSGTEGSSDLNRSPNLVAKGGWDIYNNSTQDKLQVRNDGTIVLTATDHPDSKEKEAAISQKLDAADQSTTGNPTDGQALHVRFLARSNHNGMLGVSVMEGKYPYAQSMNENTEVGGTWKEYDLDCVAPKQKDGLSLHFNPHGSVELKDVSVTPESATKIGINPNDLTKQGIDKNIEKYRQGNLKVIVLDHDGNPIPDANVHVKQVSQQFLFGTEVQGLKPDDKSKDQSNYESALSDTFNFATVTPYWPQVEKEQGHSNYENFDKQVDWLANKDFTIKMHPAFWPHYSPEFLPKDPDQAQVLIDKHTQEFAQHFGANPHVHFLENNEVAAASTDSASNGAIAWVNKVGAPNAVEHESDIERKASENGRVGEPLKIVYNDYINNGQELKMLDQLQRDSKLPDAIGVQMHMTQGEWPLERVQQIINNLSKYGKPIYISEISVLSGEHRIGHDRKEPSDKPWPSTADGEKRQAEYTEKLYKLLYSNKNVEGITWWDLSDKNSWQGAPRGLLRDDMSHKPAYDVLHNLISHEWRSDLKGTTSSTGESDQRVFLGNYEITATDKDGKSTVQKVTVSDNQDSPNVVKIKMP